VGILCVSNAWGGLEQTALEDFELLAPHLQVRILVLRGSPLAQELKRRNHSTLSIHELDEVPKKWGSRAWFQVLDQWSELSVQILHTHQPQLLWAIRLWTRTKPQVGLVVSRHIFNNHAKKGPFFRWLFSGVDAFLCVSEAMKRNVLETHEISQGKVMVLPLAVEVDPISEGTRAEWRQAVRASWNAAEFDSVVGVLGRIDPNKGQDLVIDAAISLAKQGSTSLKWVIVGEPTRGGDSEFLPGLKRRVREAGIESQVIWAGFSDEIERTLAGFDVLLMPSREEAFGLVAVEGLSHRVPLIMSRVESVDEITESGNLAEVIERGSSQAIVVAVEKYLRSKGEWATRAERAYQSVSKRFSKKARLSHTLAVYQAVRDEHMPEVQMTRGTYRS
jgi:glycosyltransferase involved in cell wall biosynthesis